MELHVPDYLLTFNAMTRAALLGAVLTLIWYGAVRSPLPRREWLTTAGILTAGLLVWFAVARYLGQQNLYWAPNNPDLPTIQFGILVPILLGLVLIVRSGRMSRFVDALPLSWLVGVQAYRTLGAIFLLLWFGGHLPWQFAVPAGVGDVATGVLAIVAAVMVSRQAPGAHRAVYAWCLFGIADLVIAVSLGALTSPGRTQLLALDNPNMLVTAYPLVMIPTFAVPLSIILHGVCLWKLRRLAGVPYETSRHSREGGTPA